MADPHQSEIQISNLPTKSVILTPQRATITREIHTTIHPGQNVITIQGLDPNVDLDSVQIDGSGPAIITDMQTDVVPRREKFNDVYPDLTVDEESDIDQDMTTDEEGINIDDSELQAILKEEQTLNTSIAKAQDDKSASLFVLQFLVGYGKSIDSTNSDPAKLNDFLQMYLQQRKTEGDRARDTEVKIVDSEKVLERVKRKRERLESAHTKAKEAALKDARRAREKRVRERRERRAQQKRDINEKRQFWKDRVGQVEVYLDGHVSATPESSRRSSVTENATYGGQPIEVTMNLTYIVPGPSWAPRYNLKINTPASTASLIYNADFQNNCSETWKDAKITLSTSHAAFSGLDEPIPILQPWHVTTCSISDPQSISWQDVLRSPAEINPNAMATNMSSYPATVDVQARARAQMIANARSLQESGAVQNAQQLQQQALAQQAMAQQAPIARGVVARREPRTTPRDSRHSWVPSARRALGWGVSEGNEDNEEADDSGSDAETNASPSLERQDSVPQNYGLTTTYELSGLRTLAPSTSHRRHLIAQSTLQSLTLTHVIVPKIRAAAFLRARVKNTSSVNILRGKTGISVDGTFLGSSTLPNCAPNDFFNISLGVDPNVLVTYAKPTVRKLASGYISKEKAAVFRRSCWVKNTKSTAIDMIVSDQIPLKDNEQMRIQVLEPKGLEKEGSEVDMPLERDRGRGKAVMMRNGEVKWFIRLAPGKDVRMALEYHARCLMEVR
ncbi:hypothetical protein ANOM_001678 [Aspergillus nomiae NRRL 13137]|uniref:Mucoidy inhibitor A n=1 Tax=Aspergillus nomiae NRRL (strain ATCC 15546 / NRRL 13137 / CBS 260.88 / M93) TaxID=1509407 RepID=A0A0L1JE20_ASPN3|nr:uncharacterized protein ANOM_001678 [Aspergillus nomiae NRRL 13137]KNG89951.1 hypothetical protein ANOM_001678 [Aspergillus nomiae NRRL 13137]